MLIVQFRPRRQEALLSLHGNAMEGFTHGMSQQDEEADLTAIERIYLQGGGEFLVGVLGDRVVAMGGFQRVSDSTAELRRMRIERQFQGKGYGTRLLRELEDIAYQRGVPLVGVDLVISKPFDLQQLRNGITRLLGKP